MSKESKVGDNIILNHKCSICNEEINMSQNFIQTKGADFHLECKIKEEKNRVYSDIYTILLDLDAPNIVFEKITEYFKEMMKTNSEVSE